MTCSIQIERIRGLITEDGGNPLRLVVSGTAEGCFSIEVGVRIGVLSLPPRPAAVDFLTGQWSASFEAGQDYPRDHTRLCGAGADIEVVCTSATDDPCEEEERLTIECVRGDPSAGSGEEPNCPSAHNTGVQVSPDCVTATRRAVSISARVTPQSGNPASATLRVAPLDPSSPIPVLDLDSKADQSGPFDLEGMVALPGGAYESYVEVTRPENCGRRADVLFQVAPCGGGGIPPGDRPDDTRPDPPSTPPSIDWCAVSFWVALGLAIIGIVIMAVALCAISPTIPPPVIVVLAIIAGVGLALLKLGVLLLYGWILICGRCRRNCGLLELLFEVSVLLTVVFGLLAVFVGGPAAALGHMVCWLGWTVGAVVFGHFAAILLWYMRLVGCKPYPDIWPADWPRPQIPEIFRINCND